ncbi:MAG: sigma-70 family RNA polymerase sigma factor [Kiritimatiellales bacterium]|nr:sigma-70 family RNA polymerase sigma factor [Kiritimatiellales bacterium]
MSEPGKTEIPDEMLMARFCATLDDAAFRELTMRYWPPALAIARGKLGRDDLAKDAVQETLIRIVRNRERYNRERPFAPWFYTILRNICTDFQRKEFRHRQKLEDYAEVMPRHEPTGHKKHIRELLGKLPDADKEILVLRNYQGMPLAEIGDYYGISEEAAKKRAQRALAKLKKLYENH